MPKNHLRPTVAKAATLSVGDFLAFTQDDSFQMRPVVAGTVYETDKWVWMKVAAIPEPDGGDWRETKLNEKSQAWIECTHSLGGSIIVFLNPGDRVVLSRERQLPTLETFHPPSEL